MMSIDSMIDGLFTNGWYLWDDFLSLSEVRELKNILPQQWQPAGIGRDEQHIVTSSVRRDEIHWITPAMGSIAMNYLTKMETIRQNVNQNLYLGLFEYEAHFARYMPGAFYKKHYDSFQGSSNRRLTTVLYLNENWVDENGGCLRLYNNKDEHLADIAPQAGRLAIFLSEQFPHEVLPAHCERLSITGWFRINGVSEQQFNIAN